MKILKLITLSGLVLLPTSVLADWRGFYLGGAVALAANVDIETSADGNEETEIHNPAGLFLGYQAQNGQFVYGGEYSIMISGDVAFEDDSDTSFAVGYGDLKARFGYDAGDFLLYGLVSSSAIILADTSDDLTAAGFGFGLGVDYAVSENFIVGGELVSRQSSDVTVNSIDLDDTDLTAPSISLRASYKF